MSKFKMALKPYSLEAALAADRGDACIIIDFGCDKHGQSAPSLERVVEHVDQFIKRPHLSAFAVTKLYVIGAWSLTQYEEGEETDPETKSIDVSASCIALSFTLQKRCGPSKISWHKLKLIQTTDTYTWCRKVERSHREDQDPS
jgi:hypothetical protein